MQRAFTAVLCRVVRRKEQEGSRGVRRGGDVSSSAHRSLMTHRADLMLTHLALILRLYDGLLLRNIVLALSGGALPCTATTDQSEECAWKEPGI